MMNPDKNDGTTDAGAASLPEVALAKGVLLQAKRDLRRFAAAEDRIGREIYTDAQSWVTANDFTWPYSFQNICKALRLSPESLRAELLPDIRPGWFAHSRRVAQTISSSLRDSFANAFRGHRTGLGGRHSRRPVLAH